MFLDDDLRRAAQAVSLAMADGLPAPEDCRHAFSPAFTRRMARLIRRTKHPVLYPALRSVACLLLAMLLGSSIWLTVNVEAREAFFGWVGEQIENVQHYFFDGPDAGETPNVRYRLAEIPEGYEELDTDCSPLSVTVLYVNHDGRFLRFGYVFRPTEDSIADIALVTDEMKKSVVQVNGTSADCYIDETGETGNVLVWRDHEKDALLYISGYFNQSTLIHMAETVIQIEK